MKFTPLSVRLLSTFLFLFLLFCSPAGFAQLPDYCATDIKVEEALKLHPEQFKNYLKHRQNQVQDDTKEFATGYSSAHLSNTVLIIPIVIHIIHENGSENISDAQVYDGVRVLNNDFRRLNSDSNQTVFPFKSIAADCQIEFRLAKIDPDGNCTNGIDRIYSSQTNIGDDNSKLNPWPSTKYYNIWVVRSISPGGIAGYAYYPGTAPPGADGVIILHNYFGSIGTSTAFNSRVLTHETGHYLDLAHVWGSTNSPGVACGDDGVSDTPITKGWTSCNLNGSICTPGVKENVQNYMEYSYCNNMFTYGQKARMVSALNSSNGGRNNLWIPSNIQATGALNAETLCAADFSAYPAATSLCSGESITFEDRSFNGQPTAWQWSFPGGTLINNTTALDSMPVVQYSNAGTYDVSLSVSNSTGSAFTTKYNYVSVNSSTATFNSNFYSESFETISVPGSDWFVNDLDGSGISWQVTTAAHSSGQASAFLDNFHANPGDADELISPSIDIANIASPYFTFNYAYAPRFGGTGDQLLVFVSSNCGKTWYQRKLISGNNLASSSAVFSPFVPQATEWKQAVVSILNMANEHNVRIKFKFLGNGGNNVYLDDINIISTLGVEGISSFNPMVSVHPNPFSDYSTLSFYLQNAEQVKVEITDMLGRYVKTLANTSFAAGNHELKIEKDNLLQPGFYFLNLTSKSGRKTEKIIVR